MLKYKQEVVIKVRPMRAGLLNPGQLEVEGLHNASLITKASEVR